jgi:hypothetical protein
MGTGPVSKTLQNRRLSNLDFTDENPHRKTVDAMKTPAKLALLSAVMCVMLFDLDFSAAASLFDATTEVRDRFWMDDMVPHVASRKTLQRL